MLIYYRPRSKGDNTFGSVCPSACPSVCPSLCPSVSALTAVQGQMLDAFYTMCVPRSGRYMGSSTKENHMTHGIQSKITVYLSVFKKRLRSRAARSGRGLLIIKATKGRSSWKFLSFFLLFFNFFLSFFFSFFLSLILSVFLSFFLSFYFFFFFLIYFYP